jgi:hypothetical protein
MITSKLVALEKRISELLPGFGIKMTSMFVVPVEQIIRGINFDRSAYDDISFSITAFVMPLFVPAKHFGFTFGQRIRHQAGGDRWSTDRPDLEIELVAALKQQALPFLSKGETLEGFVEIARSGSQTGRTLEGLGYALARAGKPGEALDVFDRLLPMLDLNIAWQRELADQVRALSAKLTGNPAEAQGQLAQWEQETVRNLGLEEFWRAS